MFWQQLINGITIGSTYALVTIGFTMIYGVLELTNFAHSSYYMLGAYLTLISMGTLGFTPSGFFLSLLAAMLSGMTYTIQDLAERRLAIHPDTIAAYNEAVLEDRAI